MNGEKKYVYGPASVWEDPTDHSNIKVMKGLNINSNEALVVYEQKEGGENHKNSKF